MRTLAPLTVAALLAALPAVAHAEEPKPEQNRVRIQLSAPAGSPAGEIVRGGIPLPPELGVTDPKKLGLWRATNADGTAGEWVPTQWQVVSRHQGPVGDDSKPVRWALLQFPAADGGDWWLRTDRNEAASAGPDLAKEVGGRFEVDTGRLRFSVARDRFAPLSGLRTVTRGADGREFERMAVADGGLDVKMVLIERDEKGELVDRTYLLSQTAVSDIAIEENGPLRTSIRIRGKFNDAQGRPLLYGFLGFTMRIWADRGSDQLRVFFTLENNGNYGPPADPNRKTVKPMWIRLRSLDLVVPTAMAAGKVRGTTRDGSWEVENFGQGTDFRMVQVHEVRDKRNEQLNFRYWVSAQGREVARGDRSDGGIAVDDGATTIFAGVRHFWQSYPKAMSFDDGRLQIELWPKEKGQKWPEDLPEKFGDAYEFEGGRHKTYEVMLGFAPTGAGASVVQRAKALETPPAFAIDPMWIRNSRAMGGAFGMADWPARNTGLAEARSHHVKMQHALVDVKWADPQGGSGEIPPASMREQRETRGHTMGDVVIYDMDLYGFMNFGDLPHDRGFSSGHHDWVQGLLHGWLRHGKREYLDYAVEMLRHRYDIDQYHCQERADPNWKWYNGFQRFELGFHGARLADFHPNGEATGNPSATWLEGLLLAYAVTGDPRAMETARENADAFVNYFEVAGALDKSFFRGKLDYMGQLTSMSNGVEQLLAFYEFTGEERYFRAAAAVFENGMLRAEEYYGNKGFYDLKGNQLQVWEVVRLIHPLIEMHRLSGDPRALSMLLRSLNFLTESAYDGGKVDEEGRYMPLQLPYQWELDDDRPVARRWYIPYNFFTADGFAYAYFFTKEAVFLDWARRVYRDGVIFFQAPGHTFIRPDFYSPASYAPRGFPDSETKVDIWMLSHPQYYLSLEDSIGLTSKAPFEIPGDDWFVRRAKTIESVKKAATQRTGINPIAPIRFGETDPAPSAGGAVASGGTKTPAAGGATPAPATAPVTAPAAVPATAPVTTPVGPASPSVPAAPARPGAETDLPVGRAPDPNPTPRASTVNSLGDTIFMDDRDAVFSPEWEIRQDPAANAKSLRVAPKGLPATATFTIPVTRPGTYRLYMFWPAVQGGATNTRVAVRHEAGWETFTVDQSKDATRWRLVATVIGSPTSPVVVSFGGGTVPANGAMVADLLRLEPLAPEPAPVR